MLDALKRDFSGRLIRLASGVVGIRSLLGVTVKAMDGQEDTLVMTASDSTVDRYDEIIVPEGWQLDNYKRNPVIQNAHQYGDIMHTLGVALSTEVKDGKLVQVWKFASQINPVAKIAAGLYRGGFLRASSVGFVPVRWEMGGEAAGFWRKYLEAELLEVSAVGIPANPNALANALGEGAIERGDLREAGKTISEASKRGNLADAGAAGQGTDSAQLAEVSRLIDEIVRR